MSRSLQGKSPNVAPGEQYAENRWVATPTSPPPPNRKRVMDLLVQTEKLMAASNELARRSSLVVERLLGPTVQPEDGPKLGGADGLVGELELRTTLTMANVQAGIEDMGRILSEMPE